MPGVFVEGEIILRDEVDATTTRAIADEVEAALGCPARFCPERGAFCFAGRFRTAAEAKQKLGAWHAMQKEALTAIQARSFTLTPAGTII